MSKKKPHGEYTPGAPDVIFSERRKMRSYIDIRIESERNGPWAYRVNVECSDPMEELQKLRKAINEAASACDAEISARAKHEIWKQRCPIAAYPRRRAAK